VDNPHGDSADKHPDSSNQVLHGFWAIGPKHVRPMPVEGVLDLFGLVQGLLIKSPHRRLSPLLRFVLRVFSGM